MSTLVNRENAMTAQRFTHVYSLNRDSTPVRARRNGKTKTWKTRPDEFQIPVKYGLKDCFYITPYNCHEWNIAE